MTDDVSSRTSRHCEFGPVARESLRMASSRSSDRSDPQFAEVIARHEPAWVPMFLARAALGLSSVIVVSIEPAGVGSVALLSAVEASALLRKHGDARASAKVSGTASPGSAWCIGLRKDEHAVWSLAITPILTRGA